MERPHWRPREKNEVLLDYINVGKVGGDVCGTSS